MDLKTPTIDEGRFSHYRRQHSVLSRLFYAFGQRGFFHVGERAYLCETRNVGGRAPYHDRVAPNVHRERAFNTRAPPYLLLIFEVLIEDTR